MLARLDFPLKLDGVYLCVCLKKQNVAGVTPKARLGKAMQLCQTLLGHCHVGRYCRLYVF